jgi:hypothetical protein
MTVRTVCMLGDHRRLVRLCEWLMVFPNCGDLPHISQTWDTVTPKKLLVATTLIDRAASRDLSLFLANSAGVAARR